MEHIINKERTIESNEILELYSELLYERIRLINSEDECPADLTEAICTLIWASNRSENVPEFEMMANQLTLKYGKDFAERALEGNNVNERVMYKMSVQPPRSDYIHAQLVNIAEEYKVCYSLGERIVYFLSSFHAFLRAFVSHTAFILFAG